MDDAADADADGPAPLVGAGATAVVDALEAGAIVAVPNVGGYSLAVRAGSSTTRRGWSSWPPTPTGRTTRSGGSTTSGR